MHAESTLAVLGLEGLVERARREGHVVGRGEGFVSREWRTGGVGLALHTEGDDTRVVCVQPFVSGLPWEPWTLVSVNAGRECGHCAPALLRDAGGAEVRALVPDYAARRKLFPVGLEVQAAVVVVAEAWRLGEAAPALAARIAEAPGAAVLAGGLVEAVRTLRNEAADVTLAEVTVRHGASLLHVVGRPPRPLEPGEALTVSGRALVRVGAPRAVRGPPAA